MSNPIEYIAQAISHFDRSIQLGKEIVRYLTPQHKEAAIALFKINDKLLQAFQNILDLYYEFERLNNWSSKFKNLAMSELVNIEFNPRGLAKINNR